MQVTCYVAAVSKVNQPSRLSCLIIGVSLIIFHLVSDVQSCSINYTMRNSAFDSRDSDKYSQITVTEQNSTTFYNMLRSEPKLQTHVNI